MPLFCAGGIATPADASLTMQLGAEGNFVGSGIFKSSDPERRARAIVEATTHASRSRAGRRRFDGPRRADARRRHRRARRPGRAASTSRNLTVTDGPLVPPQGEAERLRVGVLASQGDFAAHARMLARARRRRPRGPDRRARSRSSTPWSSRAASRPRSPRRSSATGSPSRSAPITPPARPILGTCAGMILCDRDHLGLIDASVPPQRLRPPARELRAGPRDRRASAPSRFAPSSSARRGWTSADAGSRSSPRSTRHPVVIREGSVLACAFHPELTDDPRFHALLMAMASEAEPRTLRIAEDPMMIDQRVLNHAKILVHYSTQVGEGDTCLIEGPIAAEPLIACRLRRGPQGRRPARPLDGLRLAARELLHATRPTRSSSGSRPSPSGRPRKPTAAS